MSFQIEIFNYKLARFCQYNFSTKPNTSRNYIRVKAVIRKLFFSSSMVSNKKKNYAQKVFTRCGANVFILMIGLFSFILRVPLSGCRNYEKKATRCNEHVFRETVYFFF